MTYIRTLLLFSMPCYFIFNCILRCDISTDVSFTSLIALDVVLSLFLIASVLLHFTNGQIKNLKLSEHLLVSFLFSSASLRSRQSRKGHLETNRKRKSEPEIWKLFHSYQLLASLKTMHYRSLWATNMKYLLRFLSFENTRRGDRNVPASLI